MADGAAIGIMCKAPIAGRTKTRLAAMIGAHTAAALSACFLKDIAATIETLPIRLTCHGYGIYAPAGGEAALRSILPSSFGLLLRADTEFGNVLHGAAADLLASGHDCVALVNGDSPTLPSSLLIEAIETLRRPGDRMVLGPACDGGYYLIGLKHPHRRLFEDIPWGTNVVARLTLERAAEIGIEVALLPEWYDVDDAESFGWLRDELAGRSVRFAADAAAAATREFLAALPAAAAE